MKRALGLLGGVALLAAGLAAASLAGGASLSQTISTITQTTGGGHTPVTICHKPGTPAEQTLVVDDDSVELTGHLGHGDTVGACEPVVTTGTTETTPTDTVPTTTTPTTPTVTSPPPGHDCTFTGAGKDGQPGNDDCAPVTTTAPVVETPNPTPAETAPPAHVEPLVAPPVTVKPKPKAPVRKVTAKKKVVKIKVVKKHKPVKLTGNPKADKCKDLGNGTMNCKGIVVTPGQG